MQHTDVFEEIIVLPDGARQEVFDGLVGIDGYKSRLVKEALLIVDPTRLEDWNKKHHGGRLAAARFLKQRPPLFVLAGDVGTGKTALARSFGNEVARLSRVRVELYALSLNARGSGAVGEMTRLIAGAFREVREAVARSRGSDAKASRGIILLIDEADSLAQSREAAQMHHEDRAGVNALIRGVDDIAESGLPVVVVMCTNRLDAIDPAVRRRAAAVFEFSRPDSAQRLSVLRAGFEGSGIGEDSLKQLAKLTGERNGTPYGFTYSDLTHRLIPSVVLAACPEHPVTADLAIKLAHETTPTPPFREQRS